MSKYIYSIDEDSTLIAAVAVPHGCTAEMENGLIDAISQRSHDITTGNFTIEDDDTIADNNTSKQLVAIFNANRSDDLAAVNRFSNRTVAVQRTVDVLHAKAEQIVHDTRPATKAPLEQVAESLKQVAEKADAGKTTYLTVNGFTTRKQRGVNIAPKPLGEQKPARVGSKQDILIERLSHGATLNELVEALNVPGTKSWAPETVLAGFNWDVRSVKGYGVRTEFWTADRIYIDALDFDTASLMGITVTGHPDDMSQAELAKVHAEADPNVLCPVYFLVYPEGMDDYLEPYSGKMPA